MSLSNPLNLLLLPPLLYLIYRQFFPPIPTSILLPDGSPAPLPTEYNEGVYNWMPAKHQKTICYRKYTSKELSEYDGRGGAKGDRILLAIMHVGRDMKVKDGLVRTVFDVTAGASFYGPDGAYGNFAGRDASRGMAKQSFDEDMLSPVDGPLDPLTDLTPSEIDNMQGWHEHFERKYTVCGELVEGSL